MKKIEINLSRELYECALMPIRNKVDLLQLLLKTIKEFSFSNCNVQSINNSKIILYVDKMSRVLFCFENKLFTFQFPLQIRVDSGPPKRIKFFFRDFEINAMISSLLIAIFSQESIFDGELESVANKIFEEYCNDEWGDCIAWDVFCELVKELMFFEPGYLRYDHDVEHMQDLVHPEHHLDFFYSSGATMKLGLREVIDSEWMLDLLDVGTKCKFIT